MAASSVEKEADICLFDTTSLDSPEGAAGHTETEGALLG